MIQRILIRELTGNNPVLSGSPRGSLLLSKLISTVQQHEEPTIVFLDFQGVEVATSSYLRVSVLGFRDHCVNLHLNLFPVVANVNVDIVEELRVALDGRNDAVIVCDLNKSGKITASRIVGSLDEKQRRTLEAIAKQGPVDAPTLERVYKRTEEIGATGWNNRLTALAEKGLLIQSKRGRGKEYRLVVELTNGFSIPV